MVIGLPAVQGRPGRFPTLVSVGVSPYQCREGFLGPSCFVIPDSPLSRLKTEESYPVAFFRVIFCLAGKMGDFRLTGRKTGESRVSGGWGSLVFSFRPSGLPLLVADRLRFRAYSGRFLAGQGVIWTSP